MPCLPSERCQLDNAPLCALMQQSVGDVLSPQDWSTKPRQTLVKFLPELHDGAAGLRLLPKRDVEGTGSSH
ncbi:unnamed protein product, partial [Symbiodinium microadriaticum]